MFQKSKINKSRLKDTISAFRIDYSQIMGASNAKRLSGETQQNAFSSETQEKVHIPWIEDLLPKNIAKIVGEAPESVALFLASKELTEDEKKSIAGFFNVDEETAKRRLTILEKLINTYFPNIGDLASKIKDDPHFQLLMEMISPFQAYHLAKRHIAEQRRIKNYSKSKGVDV
tara:strand:+ start:23297 stop:23815 length:519 start_codon:yes stop_codon:yes gene_type:complete